MGKQNSREIQASAQRMYFNGCMSYIHAMRRKIPSTQALLAFEAAAHRGSFTLAAQDLSVSQSAVSHQILGLEQDLDVSLFLRLRASSS